MCLILLLHNHSEYAEPSPSPISYHIGHCVHCHITFAAYRNARNVVPQSGANRYSEVKEEERPRRERLKVIKKEGKKSENNKTVMGQEKEHREKMLKNRSVE